MGDGDGDGECFPAGSSKQCWPVSASVAIGFVSLVLYLDYAKQSCGCLRTEHGVEENIWAEEGRGNGGIEEIA